MTDQRLGVFVFYKTSDPETNDWHILMPDEVPDDVKDPDVLGYLAEGLMHKSATDGFWYRADNLEDPLVRAGTKITCPRCKTEIMQAGRNISRSEMLVLPNNGRCEQCSEKYVRGGESSTVSLHTAGGWL